MLGTQARRLYLAIIKSAFEINDIRRSRATCYMDEIKRVRSYGEGQDLD